MSAPARLLRTLWEAPGRAARPALPPGLRALYGGDLALPRRPAPYVYANFVASADGVVSYSLPGRAGGGTVSGGDRGDRFTMGLLRALADAVIVGGSTLRAAGRRALWTPGFTFPAAAAGFRRLRQAHGLAPAPLLVVVSGSGLLPLDYDVFHAPGARVLVLTSPVGAAALAAGARPARPAPAPPGHRTRTGASFEIRAAPRGAWTPAAILRLLRHEFGVRHLLHEGGPTLLAEFFAARAVHEMFLSLAPVVAGRAEGIARPGFTMGTAFLPEHAPRLRLLSAKAHASLLLLRYRVMGSSR